MDARAARDIHQVLEPYHALVYFAPEAKPAYEDAGCKGYWMGYFASRAAAMGPVPAEVVIATFYNFAPRMVRRAIPDAWTMSSPERILAARTQVADAALRRLLEPDAPDVAEAAALARRAAEAADPAGRPLFAGHASLPWPEEPHLALWHAATLLREYRGDGHVALLVAEGLGGLEAHVTMVASGNSTREWVQPNRGWTDDEWEHAAASLRERGIIDADGAFTEIGAAQRARIEERTDALASEPYAALGEDGLARLTGLMRGIGERMQTPIPVPNPMGFVPR